MPDKSAIEQFRSAAQIVVACNSPTLTLTVSQTVELLDDIEELIRKHAEAQQQIDRWRRAAYDTVQRVEEALESSWSKAVRP